MHYPYEYGAQIDSPQSTPSGITAVIAAVLATVTGLMTAAATIISIVVVVDVANDEPSPAGDLPDLGSLVIVVFLLIGVASGFLTLLYLPGALLLFLRRTIGRVLVIIASALGAAVALVAVIMDVNVGTAATLALCGATLVLAALPATGRWIASASRLTATEVDHAERHRGSGPPNDPIAPRSVPSGKINRPSQRGSSR